jgi:hypothetical protein
MIRRSTARVVLPIVVALSILVGLLLPTPRMSWGHGGGVWTGVKFCEGTSMHKWGCRTGGCACVSYMGECFCLAGCHRCGCISLEMVWVDECPGAPIYMA